MRERILIMSSSAFFANNVKDRIKDYDPSARVTVLAKTEGVTEAVTESGADIVLLETNFWYGATPMFISRLLEHNRNLTVVVFGYEELPGGAVASFFRCGASGYLNIRDGLEDFYDGIKKILYGNVYVPSRYKELVEKTADDDCDTGGLAASEYWLCRLVCFGLNLDDCAEIMKITPSTARYYKARVYKKLGVHNTSSLVEKCRQTGIVKSGEVFENVLSEAELAELKAIHRENSNNVDKKQCGDYTAVS
jgi:DNA-binding NarL/FixJ family response regulator